MKNLLFLFAIAGLCLAATAADAKCRMPADMKYCTPAGTRHEIRISAGMPVRLRIFNAGRFWGGDCLWYPGSLRATPNIGLSYMYRFHRGLSFGMTLSYSGAFQKTYYLFDDRVRAERERHTMALTPVVRFEWLRRRSVRLYSSLGLGLQYRYEREKAGGSDRNSAWDFRCRASYDVTLLGMSFGRKFFGFWELGPSTAGAIKGGFGYRFGER